MLTVLIRLDRTIDPRPVPIHEGERRDNPLLQTSPS
ncbi:hypothetical protein RCH21_001523 [Arthrobacter sp. PL16]|nr:hypothetical protein [Arthrobacter sp. PL16]